ncbi:MAG: hypothetical protein IJP31_12625 [Lachnospiraceae bacterium]|nr:hypothetical protein [Lachnospiraceae bacterium]
MNFETVLQDIIRKMIQEKGDLIDLAYDTPGSLEGWFQVEMLKRLFDKYKRSCSEITREKAYPQGGGFCDLYLKFNHGASLWIELKVDENNRINYAEALEKDMQKLEKIQQPAVEKYAVLISRLGYTGSQISAFPAKQVKTRGFTYNVWAIAV